MTSACRPKTSCSRCWVKTFSGVPAATIRPPAMAMTRSAARAASVVHLFVREQLAPERERPGFDAADNSPAREPGAQGEPGEPGERSAPTRPVTLPSAGGFGMLGFGG